MVRAQYMLYSIYIYIYTFLVLSTDSVDCGIKGLGWCRGPGCQQYARLRTFTLVLLSSGLLQGACELYFRVSAKQAAFQHGYNPLLVGE